MAEIVQIKQLHVAESLFVIRRIIGRHFFKSENILKLFDFVVASVHSNLTMNEEKANARLLKAIENPYTTILGHPTGRLLLMRSGYQINHEMIIDACAANKVVIELNAHPYRLDIDWRWIHYAQNKGVLISINPDAHEKMGYHDMYFGTLAARKGGLLTKNTLNALNTLIAHQRARVAQLTMLVPTGALHACRNAPIAF